MGLGTGHALMVGMTQLTSQEYVDACDAASVLTEAQQAEVILATEVTEAQEIAAEKFLSGFSYTTTALFALAQGLGRMVGDADCRTEVALRDFVRALAAIEATEV